MWDLCKYVYFCKLFVTLKSTGIKKHKTNHIYVCRTVIVPVSLVYTMDGVGKYKIVIKVC